MIVINIMFTRAIIISLLAAAAMAAPVVETTANQDTGIFARDEGSWCSNPSPEAFWGASTANCCARVGGQTQGDRRCHNIPQNNCAAFYGCCRNDFGSDNNDRDRCF
jgi:hypothetical protein